MSKEEAKSTKKKNEKLFPLKEGACGYHQRGGFEYTNGKISPYMPTDYVLIPTHEGSHFYFVHAPEAAKKLIEDTGWPIQIWKEESELIGE